MVLLRLACSMTVFIVDAERELPLFIRKALSNAASFVCTADRDTKDIIRLRSFSLDNEPGILIATICQAALTTSAATSFFDPIDIGDRSFADGSWRK